MMAECSAAPSTLSPPRTTDALWAATPRPYPRHHARHPRLQRPWPPQGHPGRPWHTPLRASAPEASSAPVPEAEPTDATERVKALMRSATAMLVTDPAVLAPGVRLRTDLTELTGPEEYLRAGRIWGRRSREEFDELRYNVTRVAQTGPGTFVVQWTAYWVPPQMKGLVAFARSWPGVEIQWYDLMDRLDQVRPVARAQICGRGSGEHGRIVPRTERKSPSFSRSRPRTTGGLLRVGRTPHPTPAPDLPAHANGDSLPMGPVSCNARRVPVFFLRASAGMSHWMFIHGAGDWDFPPPV